jgi:hypothetical protein
LSLTKETIKFWMEGSLLWVSFWVILGHWVNTVDKLEEGWRDEIGENERLKEEKRRLKEINLFIKQKVKNEEELIENLERQLGRFKFLSVEFMKGGRQIEEEIKESTSTQLVVFSVIF